MVLSRHAWLVLSASVSLASLLHTAVGAEGWRRRAALARDLDLKQQAAAAAEARAAALRAEVAGLAHSAVAQEHVVRDELGWVRPGEQVVQLAP